MAFSDRLDIHPSTEVATADNGATHPGVTDAATMGTTPAGLGQAATDSGEAVIEKRVSLPKPDINNITVLTENLPNDPILPWHRFDSPWLEKEEPAAEAAPVEEATPSPDDDNHEQLSLALDEISDAETASELDQSNDDLLNDPPID